jgi:hypothetical protein
MGYQHLGSVSGERPRRVSGTGVGDKVSGDHEGTEKVAR